MLLVYLIGLGAVAGFMAGLLGVGGGIILVPGLYMIFEQVHGSVPFDMGHLMHICVGTSLAIIIPTGLSSARAHYRRGGVEIKVLKDVGVGVVIGVCIATLMAGMFDIKTMKMIFATALLLLGALMIIDPSKLVQRSALPGQPIIGIAGSIIGALSALIGIGGATMSVPYMTIHGMKIHKAVGTASALGLIISIPAALGYVIIGWGAAGLPPYSLGYVNMLAWLCIIPASVLCAPWGAAVAHKVSVKTLRVMFGMFVILVAMDMWRKIIMA